MRDNQYREFRSNIPILVLAASGFLCVSHIIRIATNNVHCQ
jgi:hypothetical protein